MATFVDFLDSFALPHDAHGHQSMVVSLIGRLLYKKLHFCPLNMKTLLELSTIFIEMSTRTENDMSDALDGRNTETSARASLHRHKEEIVVILRFSLSLSPLCSLMLNIFRFLYTSLSLLIAAAVSATCQKIIRGTSMQLPRKSRLLLPSNCTNSQLFIHKYCTEFVKSLTTTTYILKIPSPFIQHAVLLCSAHNIKLIRNHTEQDI